MVVTVAAAAVSVTQGHCLICDVCNFVGRNGSWMTLRLAVRLVKANLETFTLPVKRKQNSS